MKIDFVKEIIECFKKQYPEKMLEYSALIQGKLRFTKAMLTDNDFVETLQELIILIENLQRKNIKENG